MRKFRSEFLRTKAQHVGHIDLLTLLSVNLLKSFLLEVGTVVHVWNEVGKSLLRQHRWWRWLARCGNCGGIYLAFAAVDNETIANVVL